MLSIRMQRLGRKGHATYRVIVQDSRQSPSSGKYIALLGSYDPHTKSANLSQDKIKHFLKGGAHPSERVVKLFKAEKITLPKWVEKPPKYKKEIRNPDKLRKNRPPGAEAPPKPEEKEEAKDESAPAEDKPAEEDKPEEKKEEQEAKPEEAKQDEAEAEAKPKPEQEAEQPDEKKEESEEKSDKDESEKPKEEDKKQ